jgi:predicted lipoprotein with Yx(FWY)xxD motif
MTKAPKLLAAAAVLVLLLTGCGKSKSTSATATTTTAAPTTTTTAAAATVGVSTDAKLGKLLVDAQGYTLYRFDNDKNGTSACVGACATKWPPVTLSTGVTKASGSAGVTASDLGTITRADGSTQVTYKGQPQYRYAPDTKPGDTTGDGVGGVWHATVVS